MKRLFAIILAALLVALPLTAFAEERSYVYDYDDLLDDSEEAELQKYILSVKSRYGFDIVVLTASDTNGMTMQEMTDNFYDANGFGDVNGGVLIALVLSDRAWEVSTSSEIRNIIADDEILYYSDEFTGCFADGMYLEGFERFSDFCAREYGLYESTGSTEPSYYDDPSYGKDDPPIYDPSYYDPPVRREDFDSDFDYFMYEHKTGLIVSVIVAFIFALIKISSDKNKLVSVRPV
ncbi:MAG: TPM domain-containing protein, partial [Firmicutes bacterium]|nr:TPM domain-containing protein [Candidatus Colimorpha enterica]